MARPNNMDLNDYFFQKFIEDVLQGPKAFVKTISKNIFFKGLIKDIL